MVGDATVSQCDCPCSNADGGYMDINKERGTQDVSTKELSYADIKPVVDEKTYEPTGMCLAITQVICYVYPYEGTQTGKVIWINEDDGNHELSLERKS